MARCSRSGARGACAAGLPWSGARWPWSPAWHSSPTWSPSARETSPTKTPFPQAERAAAKTVDWPLYGHDLERTRYLPGKHLDPPFRSSLWSFQAGKLLEFQPIVDQEPRLLHGQGRDVLRAQHRQGQGRVEAQDRVPERIVARLLGRPPVRRQPRAAPGGGTRAAQARQQGAVAPPAAGAHRVVAAGPRGQGDLRLRVGRHLRPRREDGQDQVDREHGRRRQGRSGVRRRHRLRRPTTPARSARSTPAAAT